MIDESNLPKHIAIIMDGNGRWARLQEKIDFLDTQWDRGCSQSSRSCRTIKNRALNTLRILHRELEQAKNGGEYPHGSVDQSFKKD